MENVILWNNIGYARSNISSNIIGSRGDRYDDCKL